MSFMCLRAIRVAAVSEVLSSLQSDLLRALGTCLLCAYVRHVVALQSYSGCLARTVPAG